MAERDRPEGEHYSRRERRGELPPYHRSARFSGDEPAGHAYEQLQESLYSGPPNDLSAYRLIFNQIYYLSILGQKPPDELERQLEAILAAGEPAELPQDILKTLTERRRQSIKQGRWVEKHFRPGQRS